MSTSHRILVIVPAADPLATLAAADELTVTYASGQTEPIKVRALAVKEFKAALRVVDDEQAFVALVCNRKPEWTELLTPASYTAVAVKARQMNEDFFAYSARAIANVTALTPGGLATLMAGKKG